MQWLDFLFLCGGVGRWGFWESTWLIHLEFHLPDMPSLPQYSTLMYCTLPLPLCLAVCSLCLRLLFFLMYFCGFLPPLWPLLSLFLSDTVAYSCPRTSSPTQLLRVASRSPVAPGKGLLLQEAGRAVLCVCQHVFVRLGACEKGTTSSAASNFQHVQLSFPEVLSCWILPRSSKETSFEGVFLAELFMMQSNEIIWDHLS